MKTFMFILLLSLLGSNLIEARANPQLDSAVAGPAADVAAPAGPEPVADAAGAPVADAAGAPTITPVVAVGASAAQPVDPNANPAEPVARADANPAVTADGVTKGVTTTPNAITYGHPLGDVRRNVGDSESPKDKVVKIVKLFCELLGLTCQ